MAICTTSGSETVATCGKSQKEAFLLRQELSQVDTRQVVEE